MAEGIRSSSGEFDGCARECRVTRVHSLAWGRCEFAVKPEPTLTIYRPFVAGDGVMSIGPVTFTREELVKRMFLLLKEVRTSAMLWDIDYTRMAEAMVDDLLHEQEEIPARREPTVDVHLPEGE